MVQAHRQANQKLLHQSLVIVGRLAQSFGLAELYQLAGEGNIIRHFDSKQRFERFHAGAEWYVKPVKKIFD